MSCTRHRLIVIGSDLIWSDLSWHWVIRCTCHSDDSANCDQITNCDHHTPAVEGRNDNCLYLLYNLMYTDSMTCQRSGQIPSLTVVQIYLLQSRQLYELWSDHNLRSYDIHLVSPRPVTNCIDQLYDSITSTLLHLYHKSGKWLLL